MRDPSFDDRPARLRAENFDPLTGKQRRRYVKIDASGNLPVGTTANALKNVLGTYPEGWRVPISFRRDGKVYERLTRLAASHHEGELAALMESGPEKPGRDEHHPGHHQESAVPTTES